MIVKKTEIFLKNEIQDKGENKEREFLLNQKKLDLQLNGVTWLIVLP